MLFTDRFSILGLCIEVDYCVDLLLDEMQRISTNRCLCVFVTWHNLTIFAKYVRLYFHSLLWYGAISKTIRIC